MTVQDFGNPEAENIIIQAIDARSLSSIKSEVDAVRKLTKNDFCLKAVSVDDWFYDLSPWEAPPVFGTDPFGDGAKKTLGFIEGLCNDAGKDYYLGGYSLSGLFSLWAAYQTDIFKGTAAASPSMWFPHFAEYMEKNHILSNSVYLSLGDREAKTKNRIMATVDDCIKNAYDLLSSRGVNCVLEYNRGNHFTDVENRCAKAFAWILNRKK